MNDEEFLKDHPGLKWKSQHIIRSDGPIIKQVIKKGKSIIIDEKSNVIFHKGYLQGDIHETQLDKQKVKEAIEKCWKRNDPELASAMIDLKEELGLK